MEDNSTLPKKWGFRGNKELKRETPTTIRSALTSIGSNIDQSDNRPVILMGHSDPSAFPCFNTSEIAVDAIADALRSTKFNGHSPTIGILPARSAVAEYLSKDLPNKLSPDDVFLTMGCKQASQGILQVLAGSKSNILFPRLIYPYYNYWAQLYNIEIRYFDLLQEKDWEVDLDSVVAVADENTAAMLIINPGNPCANVFTYQHLKKVAETAKKLGILVLSDEVYGHITFGENPFVPMGVFGSITPIITLGSLSKRWMVPGWRMGWLVTHDPNGILEEHGIIESIKGFLDASSEPPTFIQGALPDILSKTKEEFFSKTLNLIKEAAISCYEGIKDVPGLTCPTKPKGSTSLMAKLDLSVFDGIKDDLDFCVKLAKEESVLILPGTCVGCENWLRIVFAIDLSYLQDGMKRLKGFCERHSKKV